MHLNNSGLNRYLCISTDNR